MHATQRPFQTRFRFGFIAEQLNLAAYIRSPDRSTKSTTSDFDVLCVLVGTGFQVLFHSPPGAIGHWVVFRLGGWSPRLPTGFHVPSRTLDSSRSLRLSLTWLSHSSACFPTHFS